MTSAAPTSTGMTREVTETAVAKSTGPTDRLVLQVNIHWSAFDGWPLHQVIDRVYDISFSNAAEAKPEAWARICRLTPAGESPHPKPECWAGFFATNVEVEFIDKETAPAGRNSIPYVSPDGAEITTIGLDDFDYIPKELTRLREDAIEAAIRKILGAIRSGTIVLVGKLNSQTGRHREARAIPTKLVMTDKWHYARRDSLLASIGTGYGAAANEFVDVSVRSSEIIQKAGIALKQFEDANQNSSLLGYPQIPPKQIAGDRSRETDWPLLKRMRLFMNATGGRSISAAARKVLLEENTINPSFAKRLERYFQLVPWGEYDMPMSKS